MADKAALMNSTASSVWMESPQIAEWDSIAKGLELEAKQIAKADKANDVVSLAQLKRQTQRAGSKLVRSERKANRAVEKQFGPQRGAYEMQLEAANDTLARELKRSSGREGREVFATRLKNPLTLFQQNPEIIQRVRADNENFRFDLRTDHQRTTDTINGALEALNGQAKETFRKSTLMERSSYNVLNMSLMERQMLHDTTKAQAQYFRDKII